MEPVSDRVAVAEAEVKRLKAALKLEVQSRIIGEAERADLRSVINAMPIGLAYVDHTMAFKWVNVTWAKAFGLSPADFKGKTFAELNFGKLTVSLLGGMLDAENPILVRMPAVVVWDAKSWDLTAVPVLDSGLKGIVMAIDVSQQEENAANQRAQISRLAEIDRFKSDLISIVSHELRTPLTSIAGYAEFLSDDLQSEEAPRYVDAIQDAERRISAIVTDLVDSTALESGKMRLAKEPIDLPALVKDTLRAFVPQSEAADVDSFMTTNDPLEVVADRDRISQVLFNLIGNAIKFTPPGGNVTIEVATEGDDAKVSVRDSGQGIPEADLPLVFEKFHQVDSSSSRPKGGLGLGLYISRSLIDAHGGQIGVESTPGEGSCFWFTLPL